jgi:hypothetical protein
MKPGLFSSRPSTIPAPPAVRAELFSTMTFYGIYEAPDDQRQEMGKSEDLSEA